MSDETVKIDKVPTHLAIIMDGNGRWAKKRGKIRLFGHHAGAEAVRRTLRYCKKYGIHYLTLYAFSTENWSRPKDEVNGLMKLLDEYLVKNEKEMIEEQVRFRVIGRRADLPANLVKRIEHAEEITRAFEHQLIVCLSYGGRAELTDATREIARQVADGTLKPEDITEATLSKNLYAPDVPDPDLVIRTSGELRISNFLLWEAAYSELYVTPILWPDFDEDAFVEALQAYGKRSRRFGGVVAKSSPAEQGAPRA